MASSDSTISPMHKINKKVNGIWKELDNKSEISTNIIKKRGEYSIKDLGKKSLTELNELLRRQEKILANKIFISKLPDQGKKLILRLEELKFAKNIFNENDSSYNDKIPLTDSVESLEWEKNTIKKGITTNDKITSKQIVSCANSNNIYEDEYENSNPLELLANHSSDIPKRLQYNRTGEAEISLLTIEEELKNLRILDDQHAETLSTSVNKSSSDLPFNKTLLRKLDEKDKRNNNKKKFRTNRPIKEKAPKEKDFKSPLWIESAATGCLVQKSVARSIPLQESLILMEKAHESIKGIWSHEAKEALGSMPLMRIGLPERDYSRYRDVNTDHHILDESDEETYEPLAYINGQDDIFDDESILG